MPNLNMFFYELETPISGGTGFVVEKEKTSVFRRGEITRPLHINVTSRRHKTDGFHITWKLRSTGGPPDFHKVYFFWNLVAYKATKRTFEFAEGNSQRVCTSANGFHEAASPFDDKSDFEVLEKHSFRLAYGFIEQLCKLNPDIVHPDYT